MSTRRSKPAPGYPALQPVALRPIRLSELHPLRQLAGPSWLRLGDPAWHISNRSAAHSAQHDPPPQRAASANQHQPSTVKWDRPMITYPFPEMGRNNDPQEISRSCPSRNYASCFHSQMRERYPLTKFNKRHLPPSCYGSRAALRAGARMAMAGLFEDPRIGAAVPLFEEPAECRPVAPEEVPLVSSPAKGSAPLPLCPPSPPSPQASSSSERLRCDSEPAEVERRAVLLIGVPSTPSAVGRQRRDAIRAAWMRDEAVARGEAVVCFVLSAQAPPPARGELQAERAAHGDLLLVDAPESSSLYRRNTKYSNYTKRGRGMPTFKQFAFFRHAARTWPRVPFVAKCDDDTAPNVRLLVPFLRRLSCAQSPPFLFLGAINWAAVVPRAAGVGIRLDRCGFAWDLGGALANFGKSFKAWGGGEACDRQGAVLPVPYAIGAGYIFSAALLKWVATSREVDGWVADAARGGDREELQWQKYEDTSTGYWLSYAPRQVHYVDLAVGVHDAACRPDGARKRYEDGTYRPPANTTLLAHNLKRPAAFAYAFEHMRGAAAPYEHAACRAAIEGAPPPGGGPLLARHPEGVLALGLAAVLACAGLISARLRKRRSDDELRRI